MGLIAGQVNKLRHNWVVAMKSSHALKIWLLILRSKLVDGYSFSGDSALNGSAVFGSGCTYRRIKVLIVFDPLLYNYFTCHKEV